MPIDPNSLPRDDETLRKIVVDLVDQLDRSLAEQEQVSEPAAQTAGGAAQPQK